MSAQKLAKSAAGYVHFNDSDYQCRNCYKFLSSKEACVEVSGTITRIGGCNTFVPGSGVDYGAPLPDVREKLSQIEAGYVVNKSGFSCKRCEYFDPELWDCQKVDKNSQGPDKGVIHPEACCNNWEKDKVRGLF